MEREDGRAMGSLGDGGRERELGRAMESVRARVFWREFGRARKSGRWSQKELGSLGE